MAVLFRELALFADEATRYLLGMNSAAAGKTRICCHLRPRLCAAVNQMKGGDRAANLNSSVNYEV